MSNEDLKEWVANEIREGIEPDENGETIHENIIASQILQHIIPIIEARERERIWARLDEIDQISLDDKDFVRRVCNLIVELKPKALKGRKEGEDGIQV